MIAKWVMRLFILYYHLGAWLLIRRLMRERFIIAVE